MQFTSLILFLLGFLLTNLVAGTPTSTSPYNSTHIPVHLFEELILKNASYTNTAATNSALDTRAKSDINCCGVGAELPNWTGADIAATTDNIYYLKKKDKCVSGGGWCARMACKNNAAIWLCNMNSYDISPSCSYLAGYAEDIMNRCGARQLYAGCGIRYDTDKYEVHINGGANC